MHRTLLSLVALGLMAGVVSAQDRFIVLTASGGQKQASMLEMDETGTIARTITTFGRDFAPQNVVMGDDNRSYRVIGYDAFQPFGAAIFDVTQNGVVTAALRGAPMIRPRDILRDSDGSWLVLDGIYTNRLTVLRVAGSSVTTVLQSMGIDAFGATLDPESGALIVRGHQSNATPPWSTTAYFSIDLKTAALTTIVKPASNATVDGQHGARRPIYRAGTGDYVDALYDLVLLGVELHTVAPGALEALSQPLFLQFPMDVTRASDRAAPTRYHVFTRHMSIPIAWQMLRVRADGNPLTSVIFPDTADFNQRSTLLRIGSRHLAWFVDGPATRRTLRIDVPAEPNRRYAAGFSVTGIRPGVPLGDGRTIPLVPDVLTGLVLGNKLPGIVDGAVGQLDATGRAAVTLDTTAFGNALTGTVLWTAVVILDPNAPSGVAEVLDPTRIVLP